MRFAAYPTMEETIGWAIRELIDHGQRVRVDDWQALDVSELPYSQTHEILNMSIVAPIPETMEQAIASCGPTRRWAEDHFQERVSGYPYNPPPSAKYWVKNEGEVDRHRTIEEGGVRKYSHTYPERFWPKQASVDRGDLMGIRFKYGDLNDVVSLLARSPHTRQAVLPVFFPEDTGAVHGERVPCTLAYHFILREGQLHVVYFIRSCDAVRHFRNDIYLACRLGQWVLQELHDTDHDEDHPWEEVEMGTLTMHITSFHCFVGDLVPLRKLYG